MSAQASPRPPLTCDNMTVDPLCPMKASHVDAKGWIYCRSCAEIRRGSQRVRALAPIEIRAIMAGVPLPCYCREESLRKLRAAALAKAGA